MENEARYQENQQQFTLGCSILTLGPAIAALAIGLEYNDDSPCNDRDYLIDLKDYLVIAGSVSIAWSGFSCIILCCAGICCSDLTRNKLQSLTFIIFSCPILIWSFIYSILGLFIYDKQMSTQCQKEPIGQMIAAWSIIQILFIFAAICVMGCPVFLLCLTSLSSR